MSKPEKLSKINYENLNARQKETYNFQKVSSILADYGFCTIKLNDDWEGADFIAQHINGDTFLKVQLKGRLTISKKYENKDIYICFPHNNGKEWYLYPHDLLMERLLSTSNISNTESWNEENGATYSFKTISESNLELLKEYKLGGETLKL